MPNQPTTDQIRRWARLSDAGARINDAINDLAADLGAADPLDQLAIMAGIGPAVAARMQQTMSDALDLHYTWPEISAAIGEGSSRKDSLRVRARYHSARTETEMSP